MNLLRQVFGLGLEAYREVKPSTGIASGERPGFRLHDYPVEKMRVEQSLPGRPPAERKVWSFERD